MSDQTIEKSKNQQPATSTTQQPQSSKYQPNQNIKPPKFQISTEGYNPLIDITWEENRKK